jgi:hypothetical protein
MKRSKAVSPKARVSTMTLAEFMAHERLRLVAFEEMWRANMVENPGNYPGEMSPGDWDEQLEAWRTS